MQAKEYLTRALIRRGRRRRSDGNDIETRCRHRGDLHRRTVSGLFPLAALSLLGGADYLPCDMAYLPGDDPAVGLDWSHLVRLSAKAAGIAIFGLTRRGGAGIAGHRFVIPHPRRRDRVTGRGGLHGRARRKHMLLTFS